MSYLDDAAEDLASSYSSVENKLIKEGLNLVGNVILEVLPDQLKECVSFSAKGAAIAGVASGWIPGLGGTIAAITSAGFVWKMYIDINSKLGLKLSENILKTVASGIVTNIATNAMAFFIFTGIFSLVPLGQGAAAVVIGGVTYAIMIVAGIIYMKILTNIFKSGKNINAMSADDLTTLAKEAMKNLDIKKMFNDAKSRYKP